MRACISLLLTLVLASVGSQPLVAFSQPQTTGGSNPPCGCPQIPAIATSDKPDPRKSPHEMAFSDLEDWLSNREAQYGGDWDKALLALAHEIDPAGTMKIWTRPAPAPSNRSVRIREGWYSNRLLGRGPMVLKLGAKPPKSVDMNWALETIARSNKYGESAFGLRKALLRSTRFLSGDLANITRQTSVNRIATEARLSRQILWNAIAVAAALTQQNADVTRGEEVRDRQAAAQHQLFLDAYDLANAALDVVLSVDDKQKQEGILDFPAGAIVLAHTGYGVEDNRFEATKGVPDWAEELDALAALAGTRRVFGGSAPPGSPADAVACKAFAVLTALAGARAKDGAQFREALFHAMLRWRPLGDPVVPTAPQSGVFMGAYHGVHLIPDAGAVNSTFKATRAALIQAGTTAADDARGWAKTLYYFTDYGGASGDYIYFDLLHRKPTPATVQLDQSALNAELATMRDMEQYLKGPGKPAFTQAVDEEFVKLSAEMQKYDAYYRAPMEQWINAWQAAAPDYNPQDVGSLCPPAGATPRIIILAKGVNGRIMIKKLYLGVPIVLGVMFPEPYDGDTYPVKIQSGAAEINLTARPIDDKRLLFETEEFVIRPK